MFGKDLLNGEGAVWDTRFDTEWVFSQGFLKTLGIAKEVDLLALAVHQG